MPIGFRGITPLPHKFIRLSFSQWGVGTLLLLVKMIAELKTDVVHPMSRWLTCTQLGVHRATYFSLKRERLTKSVRWISPKGVWWELVPSLLHGNDIPKLRTFPAVQSLLPSLITATHLATCHVILCIWLWILLSDFFTNSFLCHWI